jgi:hypothetical protein
MVEAREGKKGTSGNFGEARDAERTLKSGDVWNSAVIVLCCAMPPQSQVCNRSCLCTARQC